jgi:SNF2 family DNA or RNA helicase
MTIHLIYIITFHTQPKLTYYVLPTLAHPAKSQNFCNPKSILNLSEAKEANTSYLDEEIFELLSEIKTIEDTFPLEGKKGAILLEKLLESERVYFSSYKNSDLKLGKKRYGQLDWANESDGKQRLQCRVSGGASTILPLQPLWYIDHISHECGKLETSLDPEIVSILLFAPAMRSEEIHEIYLLLKNTSSEKERNEKLKTYLQKTSVPLSEKSIDTWYCDWKALPLKKQWFDFEMGIEYEGERINLLPILAEIVQNQLSLHSFESLSKLPDEKLFIINLPNQKKLSIPMGRLKKIFSILTELYEEDSLAGNEKLCVSSLRALQFANLKDVLQIKNLKWYGDVSPKVLITKFENFKKHKLTSLPKDFQGELRLYQEQGVHWLQFLKEIGFSGILADDMGLGKTVQILSHLLIEKHKRNTKKPSLIIAPTSLVMNWQREAQRFTPTLRLLVLHGQCRKELFHQIPEFDVVLTTYPLLIRDEEILSSHEYHLFILDEAQYIKNAYSKAAQIVRRLSADQRLCLTGTPMENHLGELWSLFHFLLPGLLGDKRQFYQLFRQPIEKNSDKERLYSLKQRISPFFLRRTKLEVLPELPEKIEMVRPVILTEIQRELYENVRVALHQKVLSAIQKQGISQSQIYILDALLKLRQICCDPRLLKISQNNYEEIASSKLQLLIELLPNLILQGRRILLFSQFTEMLSLIELSLNDLKINYLKLTGKTEKRDEVIQQFQEGETPLFLISLKAGGVGLNLTKADTVIHYDPWWNPAVENQATDRAHRIGQDKTVFVYKLITAGTIEEKITALQQEKKSLLDSILSDTQNNFERLSLEDIEKLFAPLE